MKKVICIVFATLRIVGYSQEDSSYRLQGVTINSIRANQKMRTTQTIIKVKEIESINLGQDAPYLFQSTPSLSYSSDAGNGIGYTYLSLRGMDAERIQVNINGIPYNDAESHQVYWVNIPDIMSSADNVQIQRGIGYSTMGGTGLGASISIKTTKKYEKPFVKLTSSFGSFNTIKNSVQMSTGLFDNGWQVYARGTKLSSDGYIDRASSNLTSVYADISKYSDKFSSHIIAMIGKEKTYQAWYGISESDLATGQLTKNISGTDYEQKVGNPYENQIDNYSQTHFQWLNSFYINSRNSFSLSGYMSLGNGYYEEYKVGQDYSTYSNQLMGNGDLVRQLWLDNTLLGVNGSYIYENEKVRNVFSASFNNYKGNHFGKLISLKGVYQGTIPSEYYDNNTYKNDLTVFDKINVAVGNSNISLDLQLRSVVYSALGTIADGQVNFDKNFIFFNPKLGWNTTLDKQNSFYSFLGMSHKEPNRGDFIVEDRVKSPQPEKVVNLEIGHSFKNNKMDWNTNLFGMYFINQLVPTGNVNSVGAAIRENVSKSYRAGIELDAQYKVTKKVIFISNQSFSLHRILDYTNYIITYNQDYSINENLTQKKFYTLTDIAFAPNWVSYAELKLLPWANTQIQIINKIVSKQFLDNTAAYSKSLPLYSFTNIALTQILQPKFCKELRLNLLVNNIFNTHAITRGYTYHSGNLVNTDNTISTGQDYNSYFPQAGINVMFGASVLF